jgi:hypothetical protein
MKDHHIRSKLFYLTLSNLHALYNLCLVNNATNPNSNEYKRIAIVLDISGHRFVKPVGTKQDEIEKRSFLKLEWGTCAGAIRRFRFEIVNIEMTPHKIVIGL